MQPLRLLLNKIRDLENRIAAADEYDLLCAGGILRILLIDEPNLVDNVAKKLRLSSLIYKFGVIIPDELDPDHPVEIFESIVDGIDPNIGPPGQPLQEGKREVFLESPVIRIRRKVRDGGGLIWKVQCHTVRDVTKYAANAEGGIHYDEKPTRRNAAIRAFSKAFRIGNYKAGLSSIAGISRVTLTTLQPVRDQIERELSE